jgi:hypothetical protein
MLERATTRTLPLVSRMADIAPVATGCCNACRSCFTANVAGLLLAAAAPVAALARRRLARR